MVVYVGISLCMRVHVCLCVRVCMRTCCVCESERGMSCVFLCLYVCTLVAHKSENVLHHVVHQMGCAVVRMCDWLVGWNLSRGLVLGFFLLRLLHLLLDLLCVVLLAFVSHLHDRGEIG